MEADTFPNMEEYKPEFFTSAAAQLQIGPFYGSTYTDVHHQLYLFLWRIVFFLEPGWSKHVDEYMCETIPKQPPLHETGNNDLANLHLDLICFPVSITYLYRIS